MSKYTEAAHQVLGELGGGPIASRILVDAAKERGLIGDGNWVYHNFLRKIRESDEFDTSKRGYVSLVKQGAEDPTDPEPIAEAPAAEAEEEVEQEESFSTKNPYLSAEA
jgi:hypothetical protein